MILSETGPASVYEANAAAARLLERSVAARADRIGYLRLLYFFVWAGLAVYLFVDFGIAWGLIVTVLGLLGFGRLVGLQQAADAERARQARIVGINEGELESLAYRFDRFDGGVRYVNPGHPYTSDLDVFGPKSVYALVNRTVSLAGEQALADYMRECLEEVDLIEQRQAAIEELAAALGWRQDFTAAAPRGDQTVEQLDKLRAWARAEPQLQDGFWSVLLVLVPLINVLWLISFVYLPFTLALLGYVPTFWLLWRYKARIDEIEAATTASVAQLQQLSALLGKIGGQAWQSPLLVQLQARLTDASLVAKASHGATDGPSKGSKVNSKTGATASAQIARLASDVRQLAVRANPFVLLLNLFGLWEIRYARRIERWKRTRAEGVPVLTKAENQASAAKPALRRGRADDLAAATFMLPTELLEPLPIAHPIETWLLVAGAFDALNSMAGVMHRYPSWQMPRLSTGAGAESVVGQGLHHPLLSPAKSIPNNFSSALDTHISLLTGSNMAGKSTLLRTIGLHLAMAQWGMPTPAAQLSLSPVRVYTSMRTQDNLHEGASAFYAELERLRIVVDATRSGESVFFLLDEILKGTNSLDRNAGGRALIEQLLYYGGAGVVATHDLELGRLADERTDVSTLRLEVETDAQGELYFDYTVKPGLAQSRNASALMRKLGLGVVEGRPRA